MKQLGKHKTEIVSIMHSEKLAFIISVSIDSEIKIYDDGELSDSELLRSMHISSFSITSITFNHDLGKIIVGGNNGTISLFEAATGKGNEEFSDKTVTKSEEISCIEYLPGYSCFIYANNQGMIKMIGLPPLVVKHVKLCEF